MHCRFDSCVAEFNRATAAIAHVLHSLKGNQQQQQHTIAGINLNPIEN